MKLYIHQWLVVFIYPCVLDIVNHALTSCNYSKDGMFSIKPSTRYRSDVKLRSIGMRTSVSHREHVGLVMFQIGTNLICELISPDRLATCSISFRVTSLDHKRLDNSVENHIAVVAFVRVRRKVFNCLRAFLSK